MGSDMQPWTMDNIGVCLSGYEEVFVLSMSGYEQAFVLLMRDFSMPHPQTLGPYQGQMIVIGSLSQGRV